MGLKRQTQDCWINVEELDLRRRDTNVEVAGERAKDRREWRMVVNGCVQTRP